MKRLWRKSRSPDSELIFLQPAKFFQFVFLLHCDQIDSAAVSLNMQNRCISGFMKNHQHRLSGMITKGINKIPLNEINTKIIIQKNNAEEWIVREIITILFLNANKQTSQISQKCKWIWTAGSSSCFGCHEVDFQLIE